MIQGLIVTIIGMSVVFLFLALLVVSTTCMSKIVTKFFPEQEKQAPSTSKNNDQSVEIAIAIAAIKAQKLS